MGNTPEALQAIEHALILNPSDLVALSHGHEMLIVAGRLEQAIERAQRLLRLCPLDLLTKRRLVDCRCRLGFFQGTAGLETKMLLRRVSRLAPNGFLLSDALARFFMAQGEAQKARAVHRKFVEQYGQCPRGHEAYARVLAATGFRDRFPARSRVVTAPVENSCNGACSRCYP
jgi:tetratricopeptide (TPR) repeat protein